MAKRDDSQIIACETGAVRQQPVTMGRTAPSGDSAASTEGFVTANAAAILDSDDSCCCSEEEEEIEVLSSPPPPGVKERVTGTEDIGRLEDDIEMSLRISTPPEQREDNGTARVKRISVVDSQTLPDITIYKQGNLLRQTKTLGRWVKRYCSVVDHKLFMTKNKEDKLREEVLLKDATLVENSTQNVNNSFTIMTPHQSVILAATSRKEMEEWLTCIKQSVQEANNSKFLDFVHHLDGQHSWFSCSHPRPVYCNVCGEVLNGVGWRGLSCEVCKFKSHRHCVFKATQKCKWATRSNLDNDGADILPDLSFPHQWMEGNLPSGSKCAVCKRTCGSLKRLQDFRCLWCKWTVHTDCMELVQPICTLGTLHLSTLPPSAVHQSNDIVQGMWEPFKLPSHDPVLALVNSKSGDNKGVRFLRRLKYWLNPLQVFDLAISGPESGLQLFQRLNKFRVIIFGGDGSIGWVLSVIDKLHLHSKCMVGVVPLGTGNDLARVLGWGAQCSDEERIPTLLTEMECSTYRLLDRWSIWFTTDTNVDTNTFNFQRSRSVGSSDSKSPMLISPDESSRSLATHTSLQSNSPPADSSDSTHLTPPAPPHDTVSINSSNSSYHSTHSRASSSATVELIDAAVDNQLTKTEERPTNISIPPKHLVVVTPPEGNSSGNRESLQDSVMSHLSTLLLSEDEEEVILSAQVLCDQVRQFVTRLQSQQRVSLSEDEFTNDPLMQKCSVLDDKLKKLLLTLTNEVTISSNRTQNNSTNQQKKEFQSRDALMARANSLKKAVQSVIDMTEKVVDDQQQQPDINQSSVAEEIDNEISHPQLHTSPTVTAVPSSSSAGRGGVNDDSEQLFTASADMREIFCMNNYFGIGLDAKIAYEFHTRREENPAQFKNRARNKILYGYLGGREFFTNTQRHLERKLSLECDGKEIPLPQRLQGLVFLNIPSYMAGTNFWGTEREKEGFSAPSIDDKLLEVVGITGFTHLATTKVLGIQNQRLAQCRHARVITHSQLMFQVDGEAWAQEPGVIIVSHKNRAKMIVKDKAFVQSLESWSLKQSQTVGAVVSPVSTTLLRDILTSEEIKRYQEVNSTVRPLIECLQLESDINAEVHSELIPHIATTTVCLDRVFPTSEIMISETADIEHLQDLDRSVKALLQETLWFLNMEKLSLEHEEEIRELAKAVETQVKRVILPQNSLAPQGGFRRASDSLVVNRIPRNVSRSPVLGSHRERALHVVNTDVIASSNDIVQDIGKSVEEWTVDDVARWLEGVGFTQYIDTIRSHNYTGSQLLAMRNEDMQALGINKISLQTQLRQAIQTLQSPTKSYRRSTN